MKMAHMVIVACTIQSAIASLRPGAVWNMRGDEYDGIEWFDKNQSQPTEREIAQAIADCQTARAQRDQAVLDSKNRSKTSEERLNALITAIDLK